MRRNYSAIWYFAGLTALFLLLIFILPANHITRTTYQLSATQYHVLLFLVELPIIAVWFAAFNGYARLTAYAKLIAKTPEGADFRAMAIGARWIAWGFPIPAIIGLLLNAIANSHPEFHAAAEIINTYVMLLVPLVAFTIISGGTRALAQRSKVYISATDAKRLTLVFVILGVLFCFFVFRKADLYTLSNATNVYYLPTWLVGLTIVVPYLYAWFIGLLAAYELVLLARHVSGVLYQRALQLLASGLVLVIAASSALQYFRTILPRSGHLAIGSTLLVTYLIEISAGVGFLLLAAGANRLKKIEDA